MCVAIVGREDTLLQCEMSLLVCVRKMVFENMLLVHVIDRVARVMVRQ